jgi:hypothetical protein
MTDHAVMSTTINIPEIPNIKHTLTPYPTHQYEISMTVSFPPGKFQMYLQMF